MFGGAAETPTLLRAGALSDAQLVACGLTRDAAALIDTLVGQVLDAAVVMADLQLRLVPELIQQLVDRVAAANALVATTFSVLIARGLVSEDAWREILALTKEQAAARAVDAALGPALETPIEALRSVLERVKVLNAPQPDRPIG